MRNKTMRRVWGANPVREQLQNFASKKAKFLKEDVRDGALQHHGNQNGVDVYSVTSTLSEGCLMRNWFWIVGSKIELVNTELKFKMSVGQRRAARLARIPEDRLNTSTMYVGIGGGKTAKDLRAKSESTNQITKKVAGF